MVVRRGVPGGNGRVLAASTACDASSEESRLHREAEAGVRLKAQRLRRALDADRLDDAIKIAADVAAELRSPAATELSPKAYYDVYLAVASELRLLELYVAELARRGAPVVELYDRVQETPLVLPRLYLLITAGSVYVKSLQAPAREVLGDLVSMCAGVQHPQRGLFLRAYLAQVMKDKLPDIGNPYGGDSVALIPGGTEAADKYNGGVRDSVEFILRNFTEMNRLWVRMQQDCTTPRDIPRCEKERLELRILVGSNISTLARLAGVDLAMYKSVVLPAVLDQIVSCHDAIAQEYLADCVAQVFPDDFQLATLDEFMAMCSQLVRGVNLKTILVSVLDRLTRYADLSEANAADVRSANTFQTFRKHLPTVLSRQRTSLSVADRISVFMSLMRLTLKAEPASLGQVDDVLGFAVQAAREGFTIPFNEQVGTTSGTLAGDSDALPNLNEEEEELLVGLLTLPLDVHPSVSTALELNNFGALQGFLRFLTRKKLAVTLLRAAHGFKPCISRKKMIHKLFDYVACLVEECPRLDADGLPTQGDDAQDERGMFDASTLSSHHEFLLSSVPGAVSMINPMATSPSSAGSQYAPTLSSPAFRYTRCSPFSEHMAQNSDAVDASNVLGALPPGSAQGDDSDNEFRDFVEGQELVSRIIYFCDDSDLENAFELYSAVRDRLFRGGPNRIAVTLPPLVMGILRLCRRSCYFAMKVENVSDLALSRRAMHFAVETVDALHAMSPEIALRLYLQVAVTAAVTFSDGRRCTGGDMRPSSVPSFDNGALVRDMECIQQHVYQNISRAFEVYESGIVTGKAQFVALELIVGTLVNVDNSLERGLHEALAARTVKHSKRLLTRSDQCLALCQCTDLFWCGPKRSPLSLKSSRAGYRDHESGGDELSKDGESPPGTSQVLDCVDSALDAARGCVNDGERVLLLLDVAHRLVRLHELGCTTAAGGGRLDEVLRLSREILDERRAKNSIVGRTASTRLYRLQKYIKSNPNEYSFLALKNI
jgi:Vacuolar protein sorting-associated protein 35